MAASGLGLEKLLVGAGWTISLLGLEKLLVGDGWSISLLLCTTGLRKQSSCLVGPPFLPVKRFSQSRQAMVGREPSLLNAP